MEGQGPDREIGASHEKKIHFKMEKANFIKQKPTRTNITNIVVKKVFNNK